jgi:hypothetical protein
MPATPDRNPCDVSFAGLRACGVGAVDIDSDWLDDMVNRLFRELKRQLSQVETAKPASETDQAGLRAANARTLAMLERTLERLVKLEQQRALMRETKVAAKHDGARVELERRIDRLAALAAAPADPGESER